MDRIIGTDIYIGVDMNKLIPKDCKSCEIGIKGILFVLMVSFGIGLISAHSKNIDLMNQCGTEVSEAIKNQE